MTGAGQVRARYWSIDIVRGVIMIIMALDHASAFYNADRPRPEVGLPGFPVTTYANIWQQITREVTHICAPGFQFLAGAGLAISVCRRLRTGHTQWRISGDMVLRATVLFFCEWVLLFKFMDGVPFFFVVLCCIGSAMIIFSVARFLPLPAIAAGSLAVLLTGPLYCPDALKPAAAADYLRDIWTNIALGGEANAWFVLYPIFPWVGFFGLGWCLGSLYERRPSARPAWLLTAGTVMVITGALLRWFGGAFGDRMPGGVEGPVSAQFWILAKYPPTPAFSTITLGIIVMLLGTVRALDYTASAKRSSIWSIPRTFGRVALFFYVAHLYLFGIIPVVTNTGRTSSLVAVYMVWLVGLVVLWPGCHGYGMLRSRYSKILRYF
ncbi:MAG: DUF1624 domain-containing protein [Phycisphaerales bacterium]|nr:MAG: DUF1624 domain-containing protein [Phycisphaerales bacterium]